MTGFQVDILELLAKHLSSTNRGRNRQQKNAQWRYPMAFIILMRFITLIVKSKSSKDGGDMIMKASAA